ncbi:class I SAM-dependent DNA methyltransferase [Spirilliplanes yamanashiensis]|uniref:Methyltransferase n=1 Tax=Spirilliplanes yamanashiensis TaxID=42233 RepID=A0A8J4DJM7_9ACTN|nr:class I SAM-dependent methyltransferase [Spirilliplanes yamanashiensis]MDP9817552.1 SAM-dependent methyltransferase [Spirilliplanes yamanashiensis]GIJ04362.1 methyltransferase [Spirilliplanes yamanashiensis]
MTVDPVRQAYAAVAELYIGLFGAADRVHPDDLAFIGRHLAGRAGPVLDAGCGPGHLTGHLRSLGADASGLDLVPEFLAHARARHPGVPFRQGSLTGLDVPDGSLAGILAWYSLIHLPPDDLDGVLAGFRRALAGGGALVIGFFDGDEVAAFDHKVVTAYRHPADELAGRLRRAGFTEVERLRRQADGTHRPLAAIAATASS